jgi:hypothetical protein
MRPSDGKVSGRHVIQVEAPVLPDLLAQPLTVLDLMSYLMRQIRNLILVSATRQSHKVSGCVVLATRINW